ncbi:MAG: purine-nucleoside phosphorylase [Christensenellales bacterium]|jgi:purine-nucleoside phosphorylase
MMDRIKGAADYIAANTPQKPSIGIVLGSGLGGFAESISGAVSIDYRDIPGFPTTGAPGHKGKWISANIEGAEIAVMQGRMHCYEGWSAAEAALPVRTMRLLGVDTLLITAAAGGVNPDFAPGTLMAIEDHINLSGYNPLNGPNIEELGPRFPDMTYAYDADLREKLFKATNNIGVKLESGVYAMMAGPSFETPAEIRMLNALGADAVGMSAVIEAIAANHCGMRVAALCLISNAAAGITKARLTHEEVLEAGAAAAEKVSLIISEFIKTTAK